MLKNLKYTAYGTEYLLTFRRGQYSHNNSLAIQMMYWDDEFKCEMPWSMLTVCLDGSHFPAQNTEYCAYVDTNNNNYDLVDMLMKKGVMKETPYSQWSGYCVYPCFEFNKDWVDTLPKIS